MIDNLKMQETELKGSPISPTDNHVAVLLFMLSHYVADAQSLSTATVAASTAAIICMGTSKVYGMTRSKSITRLTKTMRNFITSPTAIRSLRTIDTQKKYLS